MAISANAMNTVLGTLCVCLCVSFVSCQYGYYPSRQERRQDGGFGYNFLPDTRRITSQLAGILHLRPENQNSNPAYVYPFDRRPGITDQSRPDGYNQNQYNQNQYNPNQYNPNPYNQNQYNQNQYNPNQYNQQYPNQIGQNQQYNQDQNGQNIQFGQNDGNQNGQVAFPTSNPSQVNFVNNFNEPDPPSENGQSNSVPNSNPSQVNFVNNFNEPDPPTDNGQGTSGLSGPVNFGQQQPALPQLTPAPQTELPQLTPVPQTGLAQLTPVPSFEKRNNFNFGPAGIFQPTCTTVDNAVGSCISLVQCPALLKIVQDSRSNPNAVQLLRRAHCGFDGNTPKVCCPRPGFSTAPPAPVTQAPVVFTTTTTAAPTPTGKSVVGDYVVTLPEPPVCGVSNASFGRVVGGVKAKLGDFPWMALLGYKSRRGPGARWLCGGSLVTSKHVLTAAHCIHGHEDDLFIVRLGELDLESDTEGATPVDVPIKEKIKHEEYSSTAFTNDIGVLVLERDVTFTDLIRPICIPQASELRARSFENYNPIIAGWGDTEFQGPSATHLQALQLPVVSNDFCAKAYISYQKQQIDERVLCAGYKTGGRDACQGDSGGPLMQPIWNDVDYTTQFYQIGVVSFGRKCAEAGFPGVYTRVTHFVPWLEEKLLGHA